MLRLIAGLLVLRGLGKAAVGLACMAFILFLIFFCVIMSVLTGGN